MEDIFRAVEEGNEGEVTRLLDGDPALLERMDIMRNRPLTEAARHGQLGVMRLLIQRGANVHGFVGFWARTALHYAAGGGHEEVVALLLTEGAHANVRDAWRRTPFMTACENGHLGVARVLVQHMGTQGLADRGGQGWTALHYAALGGHAEVLSYLLEQGADASIRNDAGRTPLIVAVDKGHVGAVRVLVQHTGTQALLQGDMEGKTALHLAAREGYEEVLRILLFAGADPTITDSEGRTASALLQEDHVDIDEEWRHRRARCVAVFEVSDRTCAGPRGDLYLVCTRQTTQYPIFRHLSYTLPLMHLSARSLVIIIWQWWEGELERRYVLSRAMCLHKAYTTQRDMPASQVPTYLEARLAAGHAVPVVEVVVWPQPEGQQAEQAGESGEGKATGERGDAQGADAGEEEQRHAVLEYVVTGLNEELIRELLEGFGCEMCSCFGKV
jgi:ankyrin repeat protein